MLGREGDAFRLFLFPRPRLKMDQENWNLETLTEFLDMNENAVRRMAERGQIPSRRVAGQWRFSKSEIHEWLAYKLGSAEPEEARRVEWMARSHSDVGLESLSDLIPLQAIGAPLVARTRSAVMDAMIELAASTGWLYDPKKMLEAVRAREDLHSTALDNGVAVLHARRPLTSCLERAFVAVGVASHPIPFGSTNGRLTDVFFLLCSTDDRVHLKTLARLSRLLQADDFLHALRSSPSAQEARDVIMRFDKALDSH